MLRVFIILFSITLFTTGAYSASPAMVGGDVSYRSQYVWRGIQFNGESVLWPDLWIIWNELTFVVFGSVDLTNVNAIQGKFTEFDLFLEYTHAFKPLTLTLGYAHYTYPGHLATLDTASFTNYDINYNIGKGTGEFYSKIVTNFSVVNFGADIWCDIFNARGIYLNPSITVSHTIKELFTPELKLGIGIADSDHNGHWIGVAENGVTDFTSTLNLLLVLPGDLGNYFTVAADINYSTVVSESLKNSDDKGKIWFGFTINAYLSTIQEEKNSDE